MIEYVHLDCGLRLALEAMPATRSVTVSTWFATGSRDEPATLSGVSHFLEHLVFKGTRSRSAEEIARAIDSVGGDLNAATDREATQYYARVPSDCLELAIDLVADLCTRPSLSEESVETERSVVLEEIRRYEDSPEDLIHDHAHACLWPDSALGRTITGSEEALLAMAASDIAGWREARYRVEGAVVSIAGAFDPAEACRWVSRYFGEMPQGAPVASEEPDPPAIERRVRCDERDLEQVHLMLAWPGCAVCDPRRYAQALLDGAFGATSSSRLFRKVREQRGLVYAIWSEPILHRGTGAFAVTTAATEETVSEVVATVLEEARSLADGGLEESEFELARSQLRGATALELEATDVRSARNARSILTHGEPIPYEEFVARLSRLEIADVHERAARSLGSPEVCAAAIGPVSADDLGALL